MNKTFCVLPFYSYEISSYTGKNIYCCRLQPGADIELVRQSIKNQSRAPECQTCWKLEDAGLESERQLHNRTLDYYLDTDIERIEQEAIAHGPLTKIVKLATSNVCNGTCVTCGSGASSAWAALENKKIQYQIIPAPVINKLDFESIAQLSFVGGEPMLEKRNFQILQHLRNTGNTGCFVNIVTNGSVKLTSNQKDLLSNFNNLNICLSIDGTGSQFEYMRYPLKWQQMLGSVREFKSISKYVSVSSMISNLNVFYYNNIIDFFEEQSLTYLCKQIEYPSIFSPGNIPLHIKEKFLDSCDRRHSEISSFLSIGLHSDLLWQRFQTEVARQDQLKNIKIQDYMPATAQYLQFT